jgi:UPF0755 protein
LAASVIVIVSVVVIVGVAAYQIFERPLREVEPGRPVQIEIAKGSSTHAIADKLAQAGVVRNPNRFRLEARRAAADGVLKAGVYDLATGMPYDLVIARLVEGPPVTYVTVTIPEGFVVDQIAARLEAQVGIPASETLALAKSGAAEFVDDHPYLADAFDASLEGYLFPKTYRFKEGTTAREALETMLDQFDREIATVDTAAMEARGFSLNDIVVLASMIERESQLDKERRLVASVIMNRLDRGMRLEIDATVEYVLPGNRFRLRYSDLEVDSPYNTYKHKGLPPGPIASPGLASLQAAADPARTKYLYYVLTGKDGSHTFATNLEDFLKAKRRSKEVFGR